jgi:iron complex outermembrane recepter protein
MSILLNSLILMKTRRVRSACCALLASGILLACSVDDAFALTADSSASADAGTALAEVIVTAQKRAEDVREVPTSISVLSSTTLEQSHITGLEDITRAVPGVSFLSGGGPGLDNIEMRGISSKSGSATVGLYLDEVPITVSNLFNGAVEPRLFDLDRVEILRGPQGTLYGASSMGGTIRFISHQPDLDAFSGTASSQTSGTRHGGFNYDEQAVVNIPVVQGLAAVRLGIDAGTDSGYIDRYSPTDQLESKGVNADHWLVLRASGKIALDSTLTITPALFYQHERTDDTSVFYPQVGLYEQQKLVPEPSTDDIFVGSLTATKDFSAAQLTSISSYFSQQFDRTQDGTYYNSEYLGYLVDSDPPGGLAGLGDKIGDLPGPEYTRTKTAVATEEIRLASKDTDNSSISWIAGLFYSSYTVHNSADAYVTGLDQTFLNTYGIPTQNSDIFAGYTFPDDSVDSSSASQGEKQYAAFATVTYALTSQFKATAGLRYSHATTRFTQNQSGYFAGNGPPSLTTSASFSATTPKFSLTYDVTPDATVYASAAEGYRIGGAEPYVPSDVCGADLKSIGLSSAPQNFGSDSLWSYEGGVKGRFMDRTLSVNGDFYFVKWSKIQQTVALPTCGYAITTNVGNAQSYGPEIEVNYQPIAGLILGISGNYSHATLTSVTSSVGAAVGDDILNVPEWMASFRFDYTHRLVADVSGFVRANYDMTGPSHGAFSSTDPDYSRPSYAVLNASLGVSWRAIELSLYAKNLLDDNKVIQHPSLLYLPEAYTVRPLTAGLLLKARF